MTGITDIESISADLPVQRPAIRYHGGKFRLAPWIISHFPAHRIYVEPFCGGANVLLRKPRAYSEIINDLDHEICNLFRVLRNPSSSRDLIEALRLTPYAREEFDMAADCGDADSLERARRTMIRCWMSYSGRNVSGQGWRANASRSYSTPAQDWAALPDSMEAVVGRLRGVIIENRTASQVIKQYDNPAALIYCDPPYVRSTRSSLRYESERAYVHEMTDSDHENLAKQLNAVSGMVIVSGYRCDLYGQLFADWRRIDRQAAGSGQAGSVTRTESLWLNQAAMKSAPQQAMGLDEVMQ